MDSIEQFKNEAGQRNPIVDEINDYENTDIFEMLTQAGLAEEGDEITPDDYEAIRARSAVLAKDAKGPISAKALIFGAFADRMEHIGKIAEEDLREMPDETLRSIMYAQTGYRLSDEELGLVRSSKIPSREWVDRRVSSRGDLSNLHAAVGGNEEVVAFGDTPEQALLKAQKKE